MLTPRRWLRIGVTLGLVLALLAGLRFGMTRAEEPGAGKGGLDPKARAELDEIIKAYKQMDSYADHGAFLLSVKVDGQKEEQKVKMAVKFARPNKIAIDSDNVQLLSDGTKLTSTVTPLKKYNVTSAPKVLRLDSFKDNPVGAMVLSGPSAVAMGELLALLLEDDPAKLVLTGVAALSLEPEQKVDGRTLAALRFKSSEGPDVRWAFDPKSKQLARIELVVDTDKLAGASPKQKISDLKIEWNAGAVSTKKLDEASFAYKAPEGFTQVADLASRVEPGAERKSELEEMVGKPAPDFTMTVLDGPGKTHALSKADLAGKVVLIDFWATWCGPCMRELPEIQKLVTDFGKRKPKDVVVVALSQDNEDGDLDDVRKLVETTLTKQELKLAAAPVGLVAIDPAKEMGKAFHIEGIPSVIILDTKGVVQAVHIGFRPDVLEILTNDVDTLLGGGSLIENKEGAQKANAGAPAKR